MTKREKQRMVMGLKAVFILAFLVVTGYSSMTTRADPYITVDTELTGADVPEQIYNFLTKPGRLTPYQAAAVMGNMQHESGMQPMRLENTPSGTVTSAEAVGGRNIGWGLVQWTPASKFIEKQPTKAEAESVLVQLNFLWAQLHGEGPLPEKRAGDELRSAPNLEEAVIAFQGNMDGAPSPMGKHYRGFERPLDQTASVPKRIAAAQAYLAQFGPPPAK
ncbi:MAG TPA: phage tail tip lysozyme [Candidatus Saccharimonadales bacterium]|jgi:hypothetical protein